MRRRRSREPEETAIDLTPIVDMVFIMLIFFVVTASFIKESGIDVNKPGAVTAERQAGNDPSGFMQRRADSDFHRH